MTYSIKFTDKSKTLIDVAEDSVNTQTDIALFGRKKLEYGQDLNANLLHILENFASEESMENPGTPNLSITSTLADTTKPLLATPIDGQLWWNKTQNCMFSYDGVAWKPFSMEGDIAVNWGALCDAEQIPLPVSSSGYAFSYAECVWIVSPKSTSGTFEYLLCFTDENAIVTIQYGVPGGGIRKGIANFMIVGMRDNLNLGSIVTISPPAPTVTPTVTPSAGSPTLTPTPTPTVSGTQSVPVTPTPTPAVTSTPAVTPTVTGTPGASITPTPAVTSTPAVTPTVTGTPASTPAVTPTITPTVTGTPASTPAVTPTVTPTVTPSGVPPLVVGDVPDMTLRKTAIQPAAASAGITISSDGTFSKNGIGGSNGTWLISGSASNVEIFATQTADPAINVTGQYNQWLSMSSTHGFNMNMSALGNNVIGTINLTFRDVNTLSTLDTATITIDLTIEV